MKSLTGLVVIVVMLGLGVHFLSLAANMVKEQQTQRQIILDRID